MQIYINANYLFIYLAIATFVILFIISLLKVGALKSSSTLFASKIITVSVGMERCGWMPRFYMNRMIAVNRLMVPTSQYPSKARELRSLTGKQCTLTQLMLNNKV